MKAYNNGDWKSAVKSGESPAWGPKKVQGLINSTNNPLRRGLSESVVTPPNSQLWTTLFFSSWLEIGQLRSPSHHPPEATLRFPSFWQVGGKALAPWTQHPTHGKTFTSTTPTSVRAPMFLNDPFPTVNRHENRIPGNSREFHRLSAATDVLEWRAIEGFCNA